MPFVTSFERYARQEGLEQGLEQGLERGREEGLQTGEIRGLRQAILEVLLTRFGQISEPVVKVLDACADPTLLRAWLRVAASRPTLDEIMTELAPG